MKLLPILAALSTAHLAAAVTIEQFHPHDFAFTGQAAGNPFDVEIRGDFTGPGGVHIAVPAFYAGAGTWKIRFSPTTPGQWTMATVSPVAAFNGRSETGIVCTANTNAAVHGGLRIDPVNRHHFVFEDGSRYFLVGYEADWLWGADMQDPGRKVMKHLIDQIAARGFNHLLVSVFSYDTTWAKGHTNEWDYGPPALNLFEGTNEKPDHAHLNTAFFDAYDGMMNALLDKGIVANTMFKVYNKLVNWPAPGSLDEERYFRYVTARYQAYPNIVWDFAKEAYYEKDKALEKKLIDLIRSTDGYHRLTTAHDNDAYDWDSQLSSDLDFRTDQEHAAWKEMLLFDRKLRDWPVINSELYYERGVDTLPTYPVKQDWQDMIRGAYEVYLSGGYFAYYYSNTAWDLVKPDPEPPGMARMQTLKENLSKLPYWKMEPKPELAAGGPCLAIPGEVYAFYVQSATPGKPRKPTGSAREIVINLTDLRGPAGAEWVDTWTGGRSQQNFAGPGVYQLNRPDALGDAPGLLIVRAEH